MTGVEYALLAAASFFSASGLAWVIHLFDPSLFALTAAIVAGVLGAASIAIAAALDRKAWRRGL
jgi:hypothetical protein